MPNPEPNLSNPDGKEFVVVRHIRDMPEALLSKSVLESAGIECYLGDEGVIRMDWLWSNAVGGLKLWVRQEDAESASELLDQGTTGDFAVEGVGEFKQVRCPKCQSLEVSFEGINKRAAYAGILVGLPATFELNRWTCNSCGHQWPETIEAPPTQA
jgi:hypothetical protein